ncbi:hypothetical protein [uncultured Winogradskyella sp.]|uniref:hypothetical protein n=1 Tax=uncultured Winogradskyella sp. TaxID=395353 RepID=UPI002604B204|nr:hypothetical protein [uncultured Winogradskyella sp.]
MEENKTGATQSFVNSANEFERIERILLYLKVSNFRINDNIELSIKKLKEYNEKLEVPYNFYRAKEEDFLNIETYEHSLATMMYIRTIDNFINYFKEIISEVVLTKPQILKSNEKETLEFILSFENFEELVNAITEKKVESLFYHGINDIKDYFLKKLNIEIFKENFKEINLLVKQRNLAVHNRAKISKNFVQEFPSQEFEKDLYLNFDFKYVEKITMELYKIINEIDFDIAKKYHLKKVYY